MISQKMNTSTASLPFSSEVENSILDDSFEDGCSICLEPFTSLNPAFVTKCMHEYHLQCVLEWSQRSNQCPVCVQHLVLNDPACQEMMIAVEREERELREEPSYQENEDARGRRRRSYAPRDLTPWFSDDDSSIFENGSSATPTIRSDSRSRSTEFAAISESLKFKLSTASVRYRESLSKRTRSLKEKIMARNDSVKELRRGVQREMSAGIAGIAKFIARNRAGMCVPTGTSHPQCVEDDSVVESDQCCSSRGNDQ